MLQEYDPAGKVDETTLCIQCLLNKTANFKGDECKEGKQMQVTVLLAVNHNGSEKLPLLIICDSAKVKMFCKIKIITFINQTEIHG